MNETESDECEQQEEDEGDQILKIKPQQVNNNQQTFIEFQDADEDETVKMSI